MPTARCSSLLTTVNRPSTLPTTSTSPTSPGLKEGTEVVRDTPFSVKLDKKGNPVKRTGLIAAGAKAGRLELFREMSDFRRAGEIEGLCIDPVTDDLLVLNNRGTQIILGMSQGPFTEEGYTGEIHEVYIYEKVK